MRGSMGEWMQLSAKINFPRNIKKIIPYNRKMFEQCALYPILHQEMNLSLPFIWKNKHNVVNANIL